ncbi:MAG: hypothetical protein AW09_004679 [Candidatus Accumulibacter phosphatis]|uniref:Uncharacterized protein n=1 Tax=Candidatus Accumulibacter phosphatis TaxID=327160 RepID=A0A084Y679_9PROT|nr:MAG: hypothetical protein AW09_004679 [Candidatus Accumulibacter phosphatis]
MAPRRMLSNSRERSPDSSSATRLWRISSGITRSLQTIVDRAMVSTMTMPVAADRPPTKTSSVRPSCRCDIGKVSTKVSASTPCPAKCSRPPRAIGNTKMLISSRYSGKSHAARFRCASLTFSTTVTWNWRGRKSTAIADNTISENQPV